MENSESKTEIRRKYYLTFIGKNKDKITMSHVCDVCLGKYKYLNKSHHNKSKRHLDFLNKISS
jgi:hypothetical protein